MRLSKLSIAVAGLLASAATAQAQVGQYNRPQINPRPTVSPYLGIVRGNAAVNYFAFVRPQMEMNRQLYQLQQEVVPPPANFVAPIDPLQQSQGTGLITGHPVSFRNYSHYYGGGGGGGGSAPVAGGIGGPTGAPDPNSAVLRAFLLR